MLAFCALTLTACVTTEERLAHQALSDHWDCKDYGFEIETEGYAQCRMLIAQNRSNQQVAREAASAASMQQLNMFSMQLQQQEAQRRAAFEASVPKVQNTQCNRIGYNQLNCTTW
jgi:hypothetical protein